MGTIGDFSNLQIVENTYEDVVLTSFDTDNLYFDFSNDDDGAVSGGYVKATFDVAAVPVPAAGFLLLAGIGALGAARKRNKR
ncbi:VPLPA-CTERM sorting domain-containing protein [Aquicoccus sp. SCR17]|nr:VPLPA-CTERM sorting domain-containing protein [Carideicomes alvinocaridis]